MTQKATIRVAFVLLQAIVVRSVRDPSTFPMIAPPMIKTEGPPSAHLLSAVDDKVSAKFKNEAHFTADYRGQGGKPAAKMNMAPLQGSDEYADELMVVAVKDPHGAVSWQIEGNQSDVLRTPKRARPQSASSGFSSGGSPSSTSSGLSCFGSPSSSSSGFSRGSEGSLGIQERLTALRDCFNDGLLNESEFNELREKALKFL